MFITTAHRSLFLAVIFLFSSSAGAQQLTPARDDPAWRELVTNYFLTYAKRDIEGVLSLWSGQSPELAAQRKALGETFAAHEKIELKDVAVRRVTVEGEQVSVRAAVEMSITKRGESAPRVRRMNRVLRFVREGAAWRVSSEAAVEKELAVSLVAAKNDEERRRLLTDERELLTVELLHALMEQADVLRMNGSFEQSLVVLDVTRRVAEQIGDQEGVATVLRGIGVIHSRRGNYAQALDYYRESLALSEASGDKAGIARTLDNLGIVHRLQGDHTQAIDCYRKSLALKEELGDKAGTAVTLNNLGIVHGEQGNYEQALDSYRRSLALKEAAGDKAGIALTLNNLGLIHNSRGDYEQAGECFRKSLALKEAAGDRPGISVTLHNLGIVYQLKGDYARAVGHFQQSLKLSEALGLKAGIARTLLSIGIVHRSQGNYEQALAYYGKSLALSEELGDKAGVALALNNLGEVHQSQHNYEQALAYHQRSLKLSEAAGNKYGVSLTLGNLGFIQQARGDYEQALDYYRKSLALSEAAGYNNGAALTLNNLGGLYHRQGHPAQALEFAARASALARQIGSLDILWDSQLTAAKAYDALGRPGPARQALTDSIETVETMRAQVAGAEQDSQRFFENKLSPYLALAELLIRRNEVSKALTYAERAKARVLLDVLRGGRVGITKALTAQEQEQERQLTGRLVSLNNQLHREGLRAQPDPGRLADLKARLHTARLDYEAMQTCLYASHPELKVKRGEAPPLKSEEAATLLPDARSALLEYMVTEEKTYLFVLTRSGDGPQTKALVQVFPLNVRAKELAERAASFRRQLAGHDLLYKKTAVELYELLLGPARSLLKGKRLLTIVPDGMLWELPFQVLQPAPGRHLIEDSAIAYAPSLTVLREMKKARGKAPDSPTGPMSLLAVGNPLLGTQAVERLKAQQMDGELVPLPEAEEQVRELRRLYGAGQSTIYVGPDAREERFKADAGNYRILHLATHGIFDDASPMYSQVVLANEEGDAREDGFLEAWEIMNLDLRAELVVLSACETARGRVGAGEGLIGLSWALFVAGSPSTVVSQWKVDAASTTVLMLEFHRSLRAGKSKAVALQQATLKTLRDRRYRHPFYWAPFVLIGDAN